MENREFPLCLSGDQLTGIHEDVTPEGNLRWAQGHGTDVVAMVRPQPGLSPCEARRVSSFASWLPQPRALSGWLWEAVDLLASATGAGRQLFTPGLLRPRTLG